MTDTHEQMIKDSDMIFTQVSNGAFDDYKMAERLVVTLYAPDMSISRSGISHALKRLEQFYDSKEKK